MYVSLVDNSEQSKCRAIVLRSDLLKKTKISEEMVKVVMTIVISPTRYIPTLPALDYDIELSDGSRYVTLEDIHKSFEEFHTRKGFIRPDGSRFKDSKYLVFSYEI